jgi:hypothetical protein
MNKLLEQVYNQSFEDELSKISKLTLEDLNKQSAFRGQEIFKRLNPIRGKGPLSKILLNSKGGGFSQRISQVKGLEVKKPLSKNISQIEGLIGSAPQSTNIKQVKGLTR